MPHIHTSPGQHDSSVTAFIVRLDREEPQLLLHMHRKLGTLMPPGGHIELNETPWCALAHEVEEEAGYTLEQLKVVQPRVRLRHARDVVIHPQPIISNTHSVPGNHFHTDLDYLLVAMSDPAKAPAETESQDLRWLNAHDIASLDESLIMANIQDMVAFIFNEVLTSDMFEQVPATDYPTDKILR